MISFAHYIKKNFYKKKVIVDCSDIKQISVREVERLIEKYKNEGIIFEPRKNVFHLN